MLTDDATLTYMKAGYLEGDAPSRNDAIKLIDEIKRLRAERDEFIRELSDLRGIVIDLSHELARYKTPLVDDVDFLPSDPNNHEVV